MNVALPKHLEEEMQKVNDLVARAEFHTKHIGLVQSNFGDDPELLDMARERATQAAVNANLAFAALTAKITAYLDGVARANNLH